MFQDEKIASPQKWRMAPEGQHIELGIAEHNLFLLLGQLGLADRFWGERLLPVGTVYDPFINRGLDALIYACYQGARFMIVATPSGITLAPEGGAHQSIGTPLIGMAQDGLSYFEPAYADELAAILRWSFAHMQADDGGSVYLRLSTRSIEQLPRRLSEPEQAEVVAGGYWLKRPGPSASVAIAYTGAVAPEVQAATRALLERNPRHGAPRRHLSGPALRRLDRGEETPHGRRGGRQLARRGPAGPAAARRHPRFGAGRPSRHPELARGRARPSPSSPSAWTVSGSPPTSTTSTACTESTQKASSPPPAAWAARRPGRCKPKRRSLS